MSKKNSAPPQQHHHHHHQQQQQQGSSKDKQSKKKHAPKHDFEVELAWCIEQLQLGLLRPGVTKEQARESHEVMAVLQSKTASKAKKVHLMRTVFGDFRKWMKKYPPGAYKHLLEGGQAEEGQENNEGEKKKNDGEKVDRVEEEARDSNEQKPDSELTEKERVAREKKRLKRQRQKARKQQQQQQQREQQSETVSDEPDV